jgi:hypothetical protein
VMKWKRKKRRFEEYLEDYDDATNFLDDDVEDDSRYDPSNEECDDFMSC